MRVTSAAGGRGGDSVGGGWEGGRRNACLRNECEGTRACFYSTGLLIQNGGKKGREKGLVNPSTIIMQVVPSHLHVNLITRAILKKARENSISLTAVIPPLNESGVPTLAKRQNRTEQNRKGPIARSTQRGSWANCLIQGALKCCREGTEGPLVLKGAWEGISNSGIRSVTHQLKIDGKNWA